MTLETGKWHRWQQWLYSVTGRKEKAGGQLWKSLPPAATAPRSTLPAPGDCPCKGTGGHLDITSLTGLTGSGQDRPVSFSAKIVKADLVWKTPEAINAHLDEVVGDPEEAMLGGGRGEVTLTLLGSPHPSLWQLLHCREVAPASQSWLRGSWREGGRREGGGREGGGKEGGRKEGRREEKGERRKREEGKRKSPQVSQGPPRHDSQ